MNLLLTLPAGTDSQSLGDQIVTGRRYALGVSNATATFRIAMSVGGSLRPIAWEGGQVDGTGILIPAEFVALVPAIYILFDEPLTDTAHIVIQEIRNSNA